ncbi:hypothetical protein [Psychrobacter sp. I-STPA10]|uniref:hypothetical protein n=1 Tax=Psychrobacter sp. I-STPA10 TaxID=2585769 RepID=UPI001E5E5623|nr:hypothetical protein [Psychrobacter sp. I-STPA10]
MVWQLKRNDTKESIELPDDMHWNDEFSWSKIAQSNPEWTLTGSMVVQQGTKKAGRPITLTGDWIWHRREDLLLLRSWCDVAKLTMTLTHYDGREFQVIWRLHDTGIDAQPVYYQTPETEDEPYLATFKLMTI